MNSLKALLIIRLHFSLYGVAYNICAVANNTDLYVLGSNNQNTIESTCTTA